MRMWGKGRLNGHVFQPLSGGAVFFLCRSEGGSG
jgi:hypothetical protein